MRLWPFFLLPLSTAVACLSLDETKPANNGGAGGDAAVDGSGDGSGACWSGTKACATGCVPESSPATGCAAASCDPCVVAHASPSCSGGKCAVGSCDPGWADCNGTASDGCEIASTSDPKNCGGCGVSCAVGQVCNLGGCASSCGGGLTNCAGACVNTGTDPGHCGACGTKCTAPAGGSAECKGGACTFTCAGGYDKCGSSCAALANDPNNCGACGHDCLGGACQAGVCQALQLASGPVTGWCIQVSGGVAFWTASGSLSVTTDDQLASVPVAGGSSTVLAPGKGVPRCLSVDGTQLAWLSPSDGSVWAASTSGANPLQIASGQGDMNGVDVSGGYVYWTALAGSIWRVPFAGGTPVALAQNLTTPMQLVADAASGYAYFTTRGDAPAFANGTLSRVPLAGGIPQGLATGLVNARGVAVSASHVYWTTRGTEGSWTDGTVARVPLAGGSPQTLASGLPGPGKGIALDAQYVYISTHLAATGGSIMRVPIGGGSPTPLATGQAAPSDVAVDATAVYWVNELSGAVMKLAK